jgi:pantoate--beta-alanine ligase
LVRDPDGLAMSSRNAYLSDDDRRAALILNRALRAAAQAVESGERDATVVAAVLTDMVASEPGVRLDYAAVVDADDLEPLRRLDGDVLLALAAFVGRARLIDNVRCTIRSTGVDVDLGVIPEPSEV